MVDAKPKYQVKTIDTIPMPKDSMPGEIHMMVIEDRKKGTITYSAYLQGKNNRCYNIPGASAQYGCTQEEVRIKIMLFTKWAKQKYKIFKDAIKRMREE